LIQRGFVKQAAALFVGPGIKPNLIEGGIRVEVRDEGIAEFAVIGYDFLK
jgi:hypothetical protein